MEASSKQQAPPSQEEDKAAVDGNNKFLSDDDTGGEPEEKYRGWKAMPYVIGNETFEKLGTIGTTANLLVYLTTVYGMESASAATLLNLFSGTTNLAPLLGAFLSDTYLGRYATLGLASVASFLGMLLLTVTAAVPALHRRAAGAGLAVLLGSFALIAVGAGGIRPCNLAFGADQFDPRTDAGRRGIASFFNWYYFTFTVAMMVSATAIIYVQSSVSWAVGLAVPAALMGLSCALFFAGTRLYVRVRPEGSPFTSFARVLAAAYRKRRLSYSAAELFDPPHGSSLVAKLAYTDQLRCLDKAPPSGRTTTSPSRIHGASARCSRWRRSSAWRASCPSGPPASSTTSCSPTSATTPCCRPCRPTAASPAASASRRAPSSSSTCSRSRSGSRSTTASSCRRCSASPAARAASPSSSASAPASRSPSPPCSSPPPSSAAAAPSATPRPASCSCRSSCSRGCPRPSRSSARSSSTTASSRRTCAASPARCSSSASPSPATPAASWSPSSTAPRAGSPRTSTTHASTSTTCSSPPWPHSTSSTSSPARTGSGPKRPPTQHSPWRSSSRESSSKRPTPQQLLPYE